MRSALCTTALLALGFCAPAAAAQREQPSSREVLEQSGILLLPPQADGDLPFTDALADELLAGLHALPERARRFPGGPLELRLREAPSPLGLGDGTSDRPEWEAGRFLLYRYAAPDDPRASYRLEQLTAAERERLWRRRALVHAVLQRWDDRLLWSRRDAFRELTHWRSATRPGNSWDWAYSRARGRDSASLDLVTFAEEALVPVESLRDDALDADNRVACQELGKSRFLSGVLHALDGSPPPPRPPCPAFDDWANLAHFSHHEILFSAPSPDGLQSLFGHLLLRPVHHAPGPLGFEPAYEVAAVTGFTDHPLAYAAKGVFGGYQNVYELTSMAVVRKEAVELQQRSVRRFRLNLTPEEDLRLLERLWELERRGYFPYWFFTDNCAAFVAHAVDGALAGGRGVTLPPPPILPAGVLDSLARVDAVAADGSRGSLLTQLPAPLRSHREEAVRAEQARARAIEALRRDAPPLSARWRAFERAAQSRDASVRAAAYGALPALVEETLAGRPDDEALRHGARTAVEATVQVERYAATLAQNTLRRIDARRIRLARGPPLPSADELIARRQDEYRWERGTEAMMARLRRILSVARQLEEAPRRPPTRREQAEAAKATLARRTFLDLVQLQGELHEAHFLDGPEPASPPPPRLQRAVQRSGLAPLSIGAAGQVGTPGRPPVFAWSSAFIRERFGERRQHGMDPLIELRVLDTEVHWGFQLPLPRLMRVDMYPVAFWTVPREPRLARRGLIGQVGWGAEWRALRVESLLDAVHQVRAGALLGLAGAPSDQSHLLFAFGPEARVWSDTLPRAAAAGGFARLSGRLALPGSAANALRASATWSPAWAVYRPGIPGLGHRVEAEAMLHLAQPTASPWGVDVGGWLDVDSDARGTNTTVGVRALLRVR